MTVALDESRVLFVLVKPALGPFRADEIDESIVRQGALDGKSALDGLGTWLEGTLVPPSVAGVIGRYRKDRQ